MLAVPGLATGTSVKTEGALDGELEPMLSMRESLYPGVLGTISYLQGHTTPMLTK